MTNEVRLIDGLRVCLSGPEGGDPLLLSAGLGGHGDYWAAQVANLEGRYRVITYDHRGTGGSGRNIPEVYTVSHMAQDLGLILNELNIAAAHIIGHAAGAVAGLQFALDSPEKVRSLTTVNGWAVADEHFKYCFDIRLGIYASGGPEAYLKAQPLFLYPSEWISDNLDDLRAKAIRQAPMFQSQATLSARIEALCQFDIVAHLSQIRCPVLVVSAGDDLLVTPSSSRFLAKQLANAQHIQMSWGGHAINVTEPEFFNLHLHTFLNANSASSHLSKV